MGARVKRATVRRARSTATETKALRTRRKRASTDSRLRGAEAMKRSTDRILTTHTGSLPRPEDLIGLIRGRLAGTESDPAALAARVKSAVADIVRKQVDAGVDVVSDGEQSKPAFNTYVTQRLAGV